MNGGGGSSEDGAYMLIGTEGQPDAGAMAGGDYLLAGGFLPGGTPLERYQLCSPVVVRNH